MSQANRWLASGIFIILYGIALLYANRPLEGEFREFSQSPVETGRVVAIHPSDSNWSVLLDMEILSGSWRGHLLEAEFIIDPLYDIIPSPGDRFSIVVTPTDGGLPHVLAQNPERRGPLLSLMGFFIGALVLLGGKKGVRAVAGIGFTLSSIFFLLIPLMVRGYPIIGTTLVIASLMTVITVMIIGGSFAKIITAILGTLIGLGSALMVSQIFSNLAHINGLMRDEAIAIMAMTHIDPHQMRDLFTSGILIASLGAVLDTSVAIASAMEEVRIAKPRISPIKLFRAGMNVGRDAMGTMSNTLILAFVGSSLNVIIILSTTQISFNRILNDTHHAMEILQSISASLGIVFAVPAVSFIGALLLGSAYKKRNLAAERLRTQNAAK